MANLRVREFYSGKPSGKLPVREIHSAKPPAPPVDNKEMNEYLFGISWSPWRFATANFPHEEFATRFATVDLPHAEACHCKSAELDAHSASGAGLGTPPAHQRCHAACGAGSTARLLSLTCLARNVPPAKCEMCV